MDLATGIVLVAIGIVVFFQFRSFLANRKRRKEFGRIFLQRRGQRWEVERDEESNFVTGISGYGNNVFNDIKKSINAYLHSMSGSVIDFQLLRDAVDRHCDSVEEDIHAQTPVPLYLGLCGTMFGIIIGLLSLVFSGSILALLGDSTQAVNVSEGINGLLSDVAIAMTASIVGIIMTIYNSIGFKQSKLNEEHGKNAFIAWMQSELLPKLPSDTSHVIKELVHNLNEFNNMFLQNITVLSQTFTDVNSSYQIQADVIRNIHDMDIEKISQANIAVLQELQGCTKQIGNFVQFIEKINECNVKFSQEAETQQIFENISKFFNENKRVISQDIANTDDALNVALGQLRTHSNESLNELQNVLTQQTTDIQSFLEETKSTLTDFTTSMQKEFVIQIEQFPNIASNLEKVALIPSQLNSMAERFEQSNTQMILHVNDFIERLPRHQYSEKVESNPTMSKWMKIFIIVAVSIIVISSVINTIINLI